MDVDSTMAIEPESTQAPTTERVSSGESSSTPAAPPPLPYGLTPLAMEALREDGSRVLVYSRSRRLLFHGSKELDGAPVPRSTESEDIFADFDPTRHLLILQQGQRTLRPGRPTRATGEFFKAAIAQAYGTNCNLHAARSRRVAANKNKTQQLRDKEGSPSERPDGKLPSAVNTPEPLLRINSRLIVIKKVAGNIELHASNPNLLPKPARRKDKGSTLGVIFMKWKLRTAALPVLTLVPSVSCQLPWFYIANPGNTQGNHIFGNMATQQSILVANSDLQSSPRLLYSKDGWLLFQVGEVDSCFNKRLAMLPVFLLNPTTGARMDLPSICVQGGHAAFRTTSQGTPEVVIYVLSRGQTLTVYMGRPGDACWEEHPCDFRLGPSGVLHQMVLCSSYLYCFFKTQSLVFKLTDLSWHAVNPGSPFPNILKCMALELEGKVVMVGNPEYYSSDRLACDPIPFFRMGMNGENFEWVEITDSDEELDGRIWFIDRLQSFSVKFAGSGQKMCWFARKASIKKGLRYSTACELHCLNLATHAHCRLIADSVIYRQRAWVDLGGLSDHGLLDCGITCNELLPGF